MHVQTLVPDIEPFQNRIPMHQIVAEMALMLRQHMSQILGELSSIDVMASERIDACLGTQLRMNIRTLPSWRQREGAHTEILLFEKEKARQPPPVPEEAEDGRNTQTSQSSSAHTRRFRSA